MRVCLFVAISLGIYCAPAPTQEEIDAASFRVRVLANCLEDVAEDIGSGTFETTYAGCIDDILGDGGFDVLRAGGGSNLVLDVRDLLSEYEPKFQEQIDRATSTPNDGTRRSALVAYQILLGTAAEELREIVQ